MVRVALADDEEFVRLFLKNVMTSLAFNVVAEVEKGDDLFHIMKKTKPDMLLLDINMPNLTGIEFLKYYAQEFPKTCIIILTSANTFKAVEEASEKGVSCFIRKDTPLDQMVLAIKNTWSKFAEENKINV